MLILYSMNRFTFITSYEHTETALPCGSMLRECIRYETLAEMLLYSDLFSLFLVYIESNNFDIASDAFSTFKDLLTRHKQVVAKYLQENYDQVMNDYFRRLLQSSNYVTRRQVRMKFSFEFPTLILYPSPLVYWVLC